MIYIKKGERSRILATKKKFSGVGEKCNKEYVWKLYIEMGEKFKMELQEAV
jgi:hypothetical protein